MHQMTILKADKVKFKVKRTEELYYVTIKETVHEDHITLINLFVPNNIAVNYTKQNILRMEAKFEKKRQNIPLPELDKSSSKKGI